MTSDETKKAIVRLLDHETAVQQIAACIRERTHYVVISSPDQTEGILTRLDERNVPWRVFVDSDSPVVLYTNTARALTVARILGADLAIVTVIPKTTDAKNVAHGVRRHIPADGSRDLVVVHTEADRILYPVLFVEALDQVDPIAAAQLRAQTVPIDRTES